MNGDDMEIRVQDKGGFSSVAIEGEMNIYHAMELKSVVMKALDEAEAVELDLSGVSEFDSSGLQIVLLACREAEKNNRKLSVKASSAPVDSVIELFCLGGLLGRRERKA